jgi:hypothetical protein
MAGTFALHRASKRHMKISGSGVGLLVSVMALGAQTQLTIYNQSFAVVKENRTFDLKSGVTEVRVSDITAHLEPDSVILRPVGGGEPVRILEQNYESDPLSEGLLLMKSEGRTLDFEVVDPRTGGRSIVKGKILRSGYVPHTAALARYGQQYAAQQYAAANYQGGGQTIVEVNGKVQFGLPGKPLFESLGDDLFLKPTLSWRLAADSKGPHGVEFSYLTGGMRWEATYNAVIPATGNQFDVIGWVTLENVSGMDFKNAAVKLMAGDVARAPGPNRMYDQAAFGVSAGLASSNGPQVTERTFDDYHLYTLARPVSLLDREVKQVEFLRAAKVAATRFYVYDGFVRDTRYGDDYYGFRNQPSYGTLSNTKVWAMLEFRNSKAANLGMPLPKGTVKLYRHDTDGRDEFIGEDVIQHTPADELTRLRIGNAFDLAGERTQTNFALFTGSAPGRQAADESFEIKVRNHKSAAVDVRVVEHLYRGVNWEVRAKSMDFAKTDTRTIEFRPSIPAGGEAVIRYTVHYEW